VAPFSRAEEVKGIYDYLVRRRLHSSYTWSHITELLLCPFCCNYAFFPFFLRVYRAVTWFLIKNT